MKKIVVLGGGGFIGGHLSKRLKEVYFKIKDLKLDKHDIILLLFSSLSSTNRTN